MQYGLMRAQRSSQRKIRRRFRWQLHMASGLRWTFENYFLLADKLNIVGSINPN